MVSYSMLVSRTAAHVAVRTVISASLPTQMHVVHPSYPSCAWPAILLGSPIDPMDQGLSDPGPPRHVQRPANPVAGRAPVCHEGTLPPPATRVPGCTLELHTPMDRVDAS